MPAYIEMIVNNTTYSTENKLLGFSFCNTIANQANHATIVLTDDTGTEIQNFLKDSQVVFRFGRTNVELSDKFQYKLAEYNIEFIGGYSLLNLDIIDKSIDLLRGEKTQGFSNMTISDMVIQIATQNSLSYDIEETQGKYTIRQVYTTDLKFVLNQLLPYAISNKSGQGSYNLYFDNFGKLHFHPPKSKNSVYKKYTYFETTEAENKIKKFKLWYRGESSNIQGGVSIKNAGFDPISKEILSYTVQDSNTPQKILRGNRTQALTTGNFDIGRYYFGAGTLKEEVQQHAINNYYNAFRTRYIGLLEIDGDSKISPGMEIEITIPSAKGYHPGTGIYLVETIYQTITANAFKTELVMTKTGLKKGRDELTGSKRKSLSEQKKGIIKEATRL